LLENESLKNVQAVIFDWAGTTIDFGSLAPFAVFQSVFLEKGIEVSVAEARAPMGMAKWEHIQAILQLPSVRQQWQSKFGVFPGKDEVDQLFELFLPAQKKVIADYSQLIDGTVEVTSALRDAGVAIGSSTGYTRELLDQLLPIAAAQGYTPDCSVSCDDTPLGRPRPWMIYKAMEMMDVSPVWKVVKVDDTTVGIEAGREAGAWTVAIAESGNEMGLSRQELRELDPSRRQQRLEATEEKFKNVGADFVIHSIADLMPVLHNIDHRLAAGELPSAFGKNLASVPFE